jgi:type IV pilus assembly protein PilA
VRSERRSAGPRGFTLVELMVVVTIVGILAVIGLVAFRGHIYGSKSVEALAMVQSIRAAQERWRAENMVYLDVSQGGYYPAAPGGRVKRSFHPAAHGDRDRWIDLNPTVSGPVEFGYITNAGGPGAVMTGPAEPIISGTLTWPTPTEHWYVIQAAGNADDDDTRAFYMASSLTPEVYRQNEGE